MAKRRSTRADIIEKERQQAEIIAELISLGADHVAAQVLRCWRDRIFGDPAQHRFRCRSCACLSCRRPSLAAWWRSFRQWSEDGGATSYFILTVDDPLSEIPALAKSLRNLRDRYALKESWLFRDLAFCGITDGRNLHVICSHPGVEREQLQRLLQKITPGTTLKNAPIAPVSELSAQTLALLAIIRRGLQPARFLVLPCQSAYITQSIIDGP